MRRAITAGLAVAAAFSMAGCGANKDSADHLLGKLDQDARITCIDKQVTSDATSQTTFCSTFTLTVYQDEKALSAQLAKGSSNPTVTGYNWYVTAPDIQVARMIRSTLGGHLRASIPAGKDALSD